MDATFMGTVDVALLLKCSTEYVRQLHKNGKLKAEVTPTGRRVFWTAQVRRFAKERERQRREREISRVINKARSCG